MDETFDMDGVATMDYSPQRDEPSSVALGPDGTIYVAGDGKLVKFDKKGKQVGDVVELPFIAEMLKDKDKMKARAEKQVKDQKDSFTKMVQQYKDRTTKLEEKEKAAKAKDMDVAPDEKPAKAKRAPKRKADEVEVVASGSVSSGSEGESPKPKTKRVRKEKPAAKPRDALGLDIDQSIGAVIEQGWDMAN
jgi:hypothetical protein